METFWLLGRKDMGEANDSMVCMWRPKKKRAKKITGECDHDERKLVIVTIKEENC
jgi:hypothetical protein